MKCIIFDTETTGLPQKRAKLKDTSKWPYIVQLSWIIYDDVTNKITHTNDHIIKINDDIYIPPETIKIHKITKEISQAMGKPLNDVMDMFLKDLEDSHIIVGHNIAFDINMVAVEMLRLKKK